ncbi:hypothetical protein CJ255_02440 [Candidatus Viridilinea mediisalina]|uniref:Uncharacterized protein n=1 Tax=Candidatus Viridilinea mediisalina TaxID=2024553 RepID=A0A2A6RNZ6_9CHLR|nr:hypothetical protein CJ255_02440 [Candidatus Viridilinea mediisalina]
MLVSSFTFYLLPFTFYLLPFTFYLLPFTFYLLPFAFYLLMEQRLCQRSPAPTRRRLKPIGSF